jgi:GrpB-like predicted nucleotidyltransferase (UPF0157 family)
VSTSDASDWFDRPGREQVEILPPDLRWAAAAREWIAAIEKAVDTAGAKVEHVGSTAVPGLAAKGVIDLQLAVAALEDETSYRPALESFGLVLRQREADHRFFRPPAGLPRIVHVHVCAIGSKWEADHLRFRDLLRSRPELATQYERLKVSLAAEHAHDRGAYNAGKAAFITSAIAVREGAVS